MLIRKRLSSRICKCPPMMHTVQSSTSLMAPTKVSLNVYTVPKTSSHFFSTLTPSLSPKIKNKVSIDPLCRQRYKLLILVTSKPENAYRRANIRTTWGSAWHNKIDMPAWRTIFQLGKSSASTVNNNITHEQDRHKDMIQGNFTDSFYNLPLKVIMGFQWATLHCQFNYLLKVDDDVFVNIPNVFNFLDSEYTPSTSLYAGHVHFRAKVEREGKYMVSSEEYFYETYPRFVSGGGIILSSDVVRDMVKAHDEKNIFKLDDVYIGFLALKIGVDPTHEEQFVVFSHFIDCDCDRNNIIRHGADVSLCMEKLYKCT